MFGEPDLERLWEAVSVAMRLDAGGPEDVVEEWRRHRDLLGSRAKALTALGLDAVRYHGEGTDLTVGLIDDCVWTGGGLATSADVAYMPNLPTEEVFTSPDRRRADGVIRTTRPLVLPGAGVLVEDLVVTFANGRIVDATASTGIEAVRAQLDSDDGARSLGEVSLVEGSSRVRAAGVTFHDTLVRREHRLPRRLGTGLPVLRDRRPVPHRRRAPRGRPELLLGAHRRGHRRSRRRRGRPRRRRDRRTPDPRGRLGAARGLSGAGQPSVMSFDRPCTTGTWPIRPFWKSSNACSTSALVFITNGPAQATGSRIGRPPSTSTSRSGVRPSCRSAARHRDEVAGAEDGELARLDRASARARRCRCRRARRPAR